jgi:flagellar L-ring protein precursor FlgH
VKAPNHLDGSLWNDSAVGYFEDARARNIGDIITVNISEEADATRDATTSTSSTSENSLGVSAFFGALTKLKAANPGLDPEVLFKTAGEMKFDGAGKTTRSGALTATLPVRIKRVLPNGDFFVEGTKVVLVNEEESFLYMSGVIRPLDVRPDNSVLSSVVADVEMEYTGRGVMADRQSPGWFTRFVDSVWPF